MSLRPVVADLLSEFHAAQQRNDERSGNHRKDKGYSDSQKQQLIIHGFTLSKSLTLIKMGMQTLKRFFQPHASGRLEQHDVFRIGLLKKQIGHCRLVGKAYTRSGPNRSAAASARCAESGP